MLVADVLTASCVEQFWRESIVGHARTSTRKMMETMFRPPATGLSCSQAQCVVFTAAAAAADHEIPAALPPCEHAQAHPPRFPADPAHAQLS